jgi:hypothetical protein
MGRRKSGRPAEDVASSPARASLFSNLVCYRQGRVDGGIHTGIDAFDEPLLESFENEAPYGESDPILAWYVELRCKGDGLPTSAAGARNWLLEHQELIRSGLTSLAEELSVGLDVESYPYFWKKFSSHPKGTQLTLVCSAHRRVNGIGLGRQVRAFADHFEECLRRMSEVRPITA